MKHAVVVDANVLVSIFIHRNEAQRAAAKELLLRAESGVCNAIVPQCIVFETIYVLQNFYGLDDRAVAAMMRDLMSYPGVFVINDCPWDRVLEYWPEPFSSVADAAIVALAIANGYDSVATFDQVLSRRMKRFDVTPYW